MKAQIATIKMRLQILWQQRWFKIVLGLLVGVVLISLIQSPSQRNFFDQKTYEQAEDWTPQAVARREIEQRLILEQSQQQVTEAITQTSAKFVEQAANANSWEGDPGKRMHILSPDEVAASRNMQTGGELQVAQLAQDAMY